MHSAAAAAYNSQATATIPAGSATVTRNDSFQVQINNGINRGGNSDMGAMGI
jgi:hypothetical protein